MSTLYYGAGEFDLNGSFGFRWPQENPFAPRRIRSLSAWIRGGAGEARPGVEVEYIDGVDIVLKGPVNARFRIAIVLSDDNEGDWDVSLSPSGSPLASRDI